MSFIVTEPIPTGRVLLKTTIGEIEIELFGSEAKKTVRNFIQLCLEGYYDGCIIHRVIPGFIAQTGDGSNTGNGGECIYDEGVFEDEFNQRLKFNRRGLVGMANQGSKNSNLSQFFFTLDATPELQNVNTLFGRVVNDTLFNVLSLNDIELEPGTDRPTYPPTIKSAVVVENPFNDLVPRITAAERKEQDLAKREMKIERAKQREFSKRKGTKNKALISFGGEEEEEMTEVGKFKSKSSHEALDDPRLSKESIDDRGTSATLPAAIKRKGEEVDRSESEKRGRPDPIPSTSSIPPPPTASSSKLTLARAEVKKQETTANSLQKKIDQVQADLKALSNPIPSSTTSSTKKKKRSGPSLLQLEREKYLNKSSSSSSSKKSKTSTAEEDTAKELEGFKKKVQAATVKVTIYDSEKPEEGNSDDEGWIENFLQFRKDVTLDQHSIDEYDTIDPLVRNELSLDELKARKDAGGGGGRRYNGEREERGKEGKGREERGGGRGGGGGGRDRREGGRRDHSFSGESGRSLNENWKTNRAKLA